MDYYRILVAVCSRHEIVLKLRFFLTLTSLWVDLNEKRHKGFYTFRIAY